MVSRVVCLVCFLILSQVLYRPALDGPYLLDDWNSVANNEGLEDLSVIGKVLKPSGEALALHRRPLTSLSLALNVHFNGKSKSAMRRVAQVLHALNAFLLFLILLRLLSGQGLWVPLIISLLWMVHPLNTQAVNYIVQRGVTACSLFYLLGLYAALRYFTKSSLLWMTLMALALIVGAGFKEIIVTFPLILLLIDRSFFSESFKEAIKSHRALYLLSLTSWVILAILFSIWSEDYQKVRVAGDFKGPGAFEYLCLQAHVVPRYVMQYVWPQNLCFDTYFWPESMRFPVLWVPLLVIVCVLGFATVKLRTSPKKFLLLALPVVLISPSSSLVPLASVAFEHRTYLFLIPLTCLVVLALKKFPNQKLVNLLLVGLFCMWSIKSYSRSTEYGDRVVFWKTAVDAAPWNHRARASYGSALLDQGEVRDALVQFILALDVNPQYVMVHNQMGKAYIKGGNLELAVKHFKIARDLKPEDKTIQKNLKMALEELNTSSPKNPNK